MGRAPWRRRPESARDDEAVRRAMDAGEVTAFAGRPVTALSGGERARVAFARSHAQACAVALLDEPTASLDIRHQHRVLSRTRAHVADGGAAIVVLHDLALAAAYADRVALLADGGIVAIGPPCDVFDAELLSRVYRHPDRALALALDVTDAASVDMAIVAAERRFGRIDVLATSAAQRYPGAIEEGEEVAMRALFEENVFGPINLARRVLPGMRARRAGHIVMLARASVQAPAFEGFSHAARSALEALAEALFYEVEPLGIGVTLVDPGSGDDADATAPRSAGIADYDGLAGRAARGASAAQVDASDAAEFT